jgi:hypothetical protein
MGFSPGLSRWPANLAVRMFPQTLARIGPLAKYLLKFDPSKSRHQNIADEHIMANSVGETTHVLGEVTRSKSKPT